MEFQFHPEQWLSIASQYPVLMVLFGGTLGGVCVTQTFKLIYLAIVPTALTVPAYRAVVTCIATVFTAMLTDTLWTALIPATGTGLRWVVAVISGFAAPYTYKGAKALVAWKWPQFAAKWGDQRANQT